MDRGLSDGSRRAQYEYMYRLCCLRGPTGIIVALAEQIGSVKG